MPGIVWTKGQEGRVPINQEPTTILGRTDFDSDDFISLDYVGFRIVNQNAIISMGKQQQVKITRYARAS